METTTRLVAAAEKLFDQHGFTATCMSSQSPHPVKTGW